MSLIKTPWTSQPQQAVGADLSSGALSATTFAAPDRWNLLGGANRSALRGGIALVGDNVAKYATRTSSISSAPPLFIVAQFTRTGTPDPGDVIYSLSTGAASGAFFAIRSSSTTSGIALFYRCDDGGTFFEIGTTATVAALGDLTTVVAVVPSLSSADAYLYINGIKYNGVLTSGTLSAVYRTYVNETVNALKRDSVSLYAPYSVYGCGYGRGITETRARELSQNPWRIFKPISRRIFVPVSAGTGNGTGTGSLAAITLSSVSGSATGTADATASGSLSTVSLTAPSGYASVSVTASGSLSTVTLGSVSGTATGTSAGNAVGTGSIQPISISAPEAIAIASSVATGGIQSIGLTAPTGTATAEAPLTDSEKIDLILDILSNRQVLENGLYTLYADDGVTVLKTALAWEDVEGTIPYRGQGLRRLDALE